MNNCCNCGQPVILSCYPYKSNGPMYMCDCCNHMHQPNTAKYPSGGKMQENAYMLSNTMPFLIDNSTTSYGTKLSVSESVYTRVTRRKDPSCINLVAVLDMTDEIITNTQYAAFLEQTISNHYNELNGVLPVQKSTIKFRFYFHVEDEAGGVVYENTATSIVKDHLFHYTDVNDFFLTSYKQVFVTNIPALDFQGVYNLIIDRVEAIAENIDTNAHVTPGDVNPFYAFTNNNTKVVVNSEEVNSTPTDTTGVIASVDVNYGMPVQLGLTTRLKVAYTAFMSNTIAVGNSYGVYNALMGTTERSIEELCQRMNKLEEDMTTLQGTVETLEQAVATITTGAIEYDHDLDLKKGQIVSHVLAGDDTAILFIVMEDYKTESDGDIMELINSDIYNAKLAAVIPIPESMEPGQEMM